MADADGSVLIDVKLDVDDAERELTRLKNNILKTEQALAEKQLKKNALTKSLEESQRALEALQAKTKIIDGKFVYAPGDDKRILGLKAEIEKTEAEIKKCDAAMEELNYSIEGAKVRYGEVTQEAERMRKTQGKASFAMENARKKAERSAGRFASRLKQIVVGALFFNIVSAGMRQLVDWIGKVIRTNSEATAAIAKLKGALLTLAQPLVEVIVPAFIALVNVLTKVVSVIARLISSLFGKTIQQSQDAAESLYNESEALEGVGSAAKEAAGSLASFDEINTIQTKNAGGGGAASTEIAPDFSALDEFSTGEYKRKIDELTTYLSGALLALGAILTFSGANIPLGLALMAIGAAGLAAEVKENWNAMDGKVRDAINKTLLWSGGIMLALGAILAFSGVNIPLGIGLMAVGAAELVAAAKLNWDSMSEELKRTLTTILIALGEFLIVLGAILALSGVNIPLGLGLMAAGAVSLGAAAFLDWDYVSSNIKGILTEITTILGGFLLGIGAVMAFTGANLPLGIGLMIAGAASLATAAVLNWDTIITALKGKVGEITAYVSAALLVLGIILCLTGVALPLGIALIAAGAAGLVTVTAINWNAILDKLKGVWRDIKEWWNTKVSKYFTLDYWKGKGREIIDGFLKGIKDAWNTLSSWVEGAWNKLFNRDASARPGTFGSTSGGSFGGGSSRMAIPNMPSISPQSIPRLATGGVIPPNREFMAVLGDNKTETEVVSPLSTMKQAMLEALREAGGTGGDGTITVVVNLDGREVARNTVKHVNDMTRQAGKPVLLF